MPQATADPTSSLGSPRQFLDYLLLEKLAEGGMGRVYRAIHLPSNETVAIKLFDPPRQGLPEADRQAWLENEAVRRLSHPNIVRGLAAGSADGVQYLAMELINGITLSDLVRKSGPLGVAETCELVRQAALALQHIHDSGLVHRDVKPCNLMLTVDGQVKVIDFGLAIRRRRFDAEATSGPSFVMGTPGYMAPEHLTCSQFLDARADVYSLACTLYFLLIGQHFAASEDTAGIVSIRREAEETELKKLRHDVPDWLDQLFRRMMAKSPTARPQSMGAILAHLPGAWEVTFPEAAESHPDIDLEPLPFVDRVTRPLRTKPTCRVA